VGKRFKGERFKVQGSRFEVKAKEEEFGGV
jgi:hypothetical protein